MQKGEKEVEGQNSTYWHGTKRMIVTKTRKATA